VDNKSTFIQIGYFDSIYIGEQDTEPGTKFQIRAFVEPYDQLEDGKELTEWPTGRELERGRKM
jgi:hypothetical protein